MAEKEIWVMAEIRRDKITRSTYQLLGAAQKIAEKKNFNTAVVLIGGKKTHVDQLAQKTSRVVWINAHGLEYFESTRYLEAVWQLVESRGQPMVFLANASAAGLELMPGLAMRLNTGYASFCVDIFWNGSDLAVRRPVFGGRVYEELTILKNPAILTVRPGDFPVPENLSTPGKVESVSVNIPENIGLSLVNRQTTASGTQDLAEANCVVAGGRGLGNPENFKLLENLARVLDAGVGGSRAVVDSGWRSHTEQVGKSGKTISPDLYIACGISGAIHHVLGMNTSKVVVAIDKDPDAMIFKNADYGLVGDVLEVIPALTRKLESSLEKK